MVASLGDLVSSREMRIGPPHQTDSGAGTVLRAFAASSR